MVGSSDKLVTFRRIWSPTKAVMVGQGNWPLIPSFVRDKKLKNTQNKKINKIRKVNRHFRSFSNTMKKTID